MTGLVSQNDDLPWYARAPLRSVIGLTFAALILASAPQLYDPLVRHDDFPALLADPTGFYPKTLFEGRWLNYWWHLRGFTTPAWVNFTVYQFFWAVFAGAAAINACGRKSPLWYSVALALIIAVAPPALLISLWFNTLIPGLGLVALFAVLSTFKSPRFMRWMLLIFVPATLMAYTTYPLLLLAICLTSHRLERSFSNLIGLVLTFIASFALGLILIYSLNYFEHGVFGIPMAEWRNPTPARDLASAIANLVQVWVFLSRSAMTLAFGFAPIMMLHGAVFFGGLIYLGRKEPWLAGYIVTGMLAGLGLIGLQIIATGVAVPVRAIGFVWVLYCVLCVRVALLLDIKDEFAARMARNFLVLIIASYLLQTTIQYLDYTSWQSDTRKMADQTRDTQGPIYVLGSFKNLPSATQARIQNPRGLRLRLTYLTGREAFICDETPDACADLPVVEWPQNATGGFDVRNIQDLSIVRIASPLG